MNINNALGLRATEARCGMGLKCPYLDHNYFDEKSNLCLTLHYIFLRYAPTVVAQNGYRLSRAIGLFFDYLVEYTSLNPVKLHPTQFTDITIELARGFQDYLTRKKEPISNAEKLKSAMAAVAKQGAIPLLHFPIISRPPVQKTEPLSEQAYTLLSSALKQHIDTLYEKLEFRKAVADSQPYAFELQNTSSRPKRIRSWEPDHARSFKTLAEAGFPMAMTYEALQSVLQASKISSYGDCDTTVKLLTHKYTICSGYNNGFRLDELLGLYYPTAIDQSAIVLFLLLQSGWNKESVIGINADDFEHVLTGSINEGLAVIFSEKYRSQGLDKPFDDPKQITASSDRDNRYSIYNLILLARNLSQPLKDFEFDNNPFEQIGTERNKLFLCLRAWGDWFKNGSRHTSISVMRAYVIGVEHFLKRYEVIENGKRLERSGEVTTRLRPTWLQHKKRTTALSIISAHFGHNSSVTTDVYYDSSGAAMQERKERLRDELEEVVTLLVNRMFKGLLGKQANEKASAAVKLFTIPGKDRPLWGCENQFQPDWQGHENYVPSGRKCFHIERCLGCSRVRIYQDSLPYLMERLAHIEYELEIESKGARTSDLIWERQIIEYLIDDCRDEEVIKQAVRYRRKHSPLLPSDMSSLGLIFDDGE
jgi:hypothetical protein